MHFVSVAATFFAGLAAAVPAPQSTGAPDPATYENIDIAEFTVRENADGSLMATSFLLSGEAAANLTCSASDPSLPSEVYICGDSKYRFALVPGSEYKYGLRIYHELGTAYVHFPQSKPNFLTSANPCWTVSGSMARAMSSPTATLAV